MDSNNLKKIFKSEISIIFIIIIGFFFFAYLIGNIDMIGTTSIKEIVKNKPEYIGQEVTVVGILGENVLYDDQGYILNIEHLNEDRKLRLLQKGATYKVVGELNSVKVCICQKKNVDEKGMETWAIVSDKKSICDTNSGGFRCQPGVNEERLLLFKVKEPIIKIKDSNE